MKQFFAAIWSFLQAMGEARAHSEIEYQRRLRSGRWDY
jgi:hypothetical protein